MKFTVCLLAVLRALATDCDASAQTIGFVSSVSCIASIPNVNSFKQGLREGGLSDTGVIQKCADNDLLRLPSLVRELSNIPVSVLFTSAIQATLAANKTSAKIPIVFATGSDPVKLGLVDSLAKPGGRLTGITWQPAPLTAKRLGLFLRMVPKQKLIGVLANPNSANFQQEMTEIKNVALLGGATIIVANADQKMGLERAIHELIDANCGAVLVMNDPLFLDQKDAIIEAINIAKLPSSYPSVDYVRSGGLMSYGASINDAHRLGGIYVARVLQGEDPATLPVTQPTLISTVINLITARKIGFSIPQELQVLADEVIE